MSDENAGAKRPVRGIRVGVFENHRRLTALEERHESLRAQCERSVKKLTERVEQLEEIQKMQEMVDPCDLHEAKRFCANPKCICMDHWPPEPEQVENEIQWSINQDPKSWNTDPEPEQGEDKWPRDYWRNQCTKHEANIKRLEEELARYKESESFDTLSALQERDRYHRQLTTARKLLETVQYEYDNYGKVTPPTRAKIRDFLEGGDVDGGRGRRGSRHV